MLDKCSSGGIIIFYRHACSKCSQCHAGIGFTRWSKNGFFHLFRKKREIWYREADCFWGQKCGNTAPKTVKISNFGDTFAPQGSLVCTICTKFSDFVRVYSFKFLIWSLLGDKQPSYKHFAMVGAFSVKFSVAPSSGYTDRIKKVREVQKWYRPPLSLCQVW